MRRRARELLAAQEEVHRRAVRAAVLEMVLEQNLPLSPSDATGRADQYLTWIEGS